MDFSQLIKEAMGARDKAYTPYSGFSVGAALLSSGEKVYTGCNIENAAFTPTNCAERTAFFKAVSEGTVDFTAIAVIGGPAGCEPVDYCAPCGVCRQVMAEFCDFDSFEIILAKSPEDYKVYKLCELFTLGFSPKDLQKSP